MLRRSSDAIAILVLILACSLVAAPPTTALAVNESNAGGAAAQTAAQTGAAVDAYIESQLREQHIPGLALGVLRDGKLIKSQGYGLANIELDVPVKPETVFQTGSVGKQFTATAIMMLVEERKLSLDDPISKYLAGTPAAWSGITVRHLLTHTSGIPEYTSRINLQTDYTEDELFQKLIAMPLDFPPGEKWSYSNTGYVLLGFLIHKVTGEFYGDFLQQRIFQPLGMTSTRIISEAAIIPNRSSGYEWVKDHIQNQAWVAPTINTTADGALYTNVLDLAKWDAALYTEKLLKKSSFDQMWTPVTLKNGTTHPYGFGWELGDVNGHRLLEHGGAWQGFTMDIVRYVDDRLTVIVLTNLDSEHSAPWAIAHHVAGLYIPELAPAALKPIEDKEPRVTALLRDTLAGIAAGKPNLESFAPDSRKNWTPAEIQDVAEFLKSLGALKSLALFERKEDYGLRLYQYRAVFASKTLLVRITLNQDAKIVIMGFEQE
ncbi:MAG TPA: serine hydrolase domain-containing protein [Candidatus Acidoferrales bacterium]|jgi:CubicO group peptidase (beta-lactamase class C family)|nr:serine hydrolase domain-containing protein [Candidatus Acidoferrales bacterium]